MSPPRVLKRKKKAASVHKVLLDSRRHLYDELLERQGGGCALCGRPPSPRRRLDLDHDHKRLVVRGLLCFKCNRALPSWMTSGWLNKAAVYVDGTIKEDL